MAIQQPGHLHNAVSAADLSTNQYCAVVLDSAGAIALAGAGVVPDGILMEPGDASGDEVTYSDLVGIMPIRLGGTVAIGDPLTPDGNGKWVTTTSGDEVTAVALEVGADTNVISAKMGYKGTIA